MLGEEDAHFQQKKPLFLHSPGLLDFFSLIALVYIKRDAELDRRRLETHAAIIADDIWAVNESGARAYLQLAVKADSYQSLSVSIPGDDNYLHVTSAPLSGLNLVLHEMGLIGLGKNWQPTSSMKISRSARSMAGNMFKSSSHWSISSSFFF